MNSLRIALSILISFSLAGCTAASYSPEIRDEDIVACQDFENLSNPYDGTNEALWDYDAFDSYKSDVDDTFWYAQDSDLLYYAEDLSSQIDDVMSAIDDGLSKEEVEFEADDIDSSVDDLAIYCNDYVLP